MRLLTAVQLSVLLATLVAVGEVRAAVSTNGCAGTSSCTLGELFSGGTITVDDKLFSGWELENLDPFGFQPDFDLIEVFGLDDGGLDPGPGLEFNGNGQLAVADADFLGLSFLFTVETLAANRFIVDNSLELVAWGVEAGALLTIDESVFGSDLAILGTKHVEVDGFFGTELLFDEIVFPEQDFLLIEKDIYLEGFDLGDFAEIRRFEQRFSQVPEPAGLVLVAAGLAALARTRRRHMRRYAMKQWITVLGLLAVAGVAAPAQAQFTPTGGEAGQILACFYECKEGPATRQGRTFQEITTLMVTNQSRQAGAADVVILDGNERAIARSRLDLSSLDLDELNVCHTLVRGNIEPPAAGLVEILLDVRQPPGIGVYAWMKNVTGKFFYVNPEPFEGRVTGVAKTQCRVVPVPDVNQPDAILEQASAAPFLAPVLVEGTEEEPAHFVEHDHFAAAQMVFDLIFPAGQSETIGVSGPMQVDVWFETGEGEAQDDDGDNLDEVMTKIIQLDLSGQASFGAIAVDLNPNIQSTGLIEEQANNVPGWLDVPPFSGPGLLADSFFDIFFTVEVTGVRLHNREPVRVAGTISHKPPARGDTLVSAVTTPLFDENGNPSGFALGPLRLVPNP